MAAQKGTIDANKVVAMVCRDFEPAFGAKSRPLVMGIDPGLSGAIAVVDLDRHIIVDMIDMPTFKKPSKSRKQGYLEFVDPHRLSSLIDFYAPMTALAVIEEPGAMPNQGLSSTFRFGHVCGLIHGVLAGHYVPVVPVKPGVWKSALALDSDKARSTAAATSAFPGAHDLWKKKMHHDRAEAALMTIYAKRYLPQVIGLSRR